MRVLVVDDDRPTVELMCMTLHAFGHAVVSATNVTDALQVLERERPHIILSDLTFSDEPGPTRTGCALARVVRSNPDYADTAMLAITGVTSSRELQTALDSGFDDIVAKPFNVEALVARIAELDPAVTQR